MPNSDAKGEIRADVVYRLDRFKTVTGFKDHALRTLRKIGLRMVMIGGRKWVRGEDFLRLLADQESDSD